MQDEKRGEDLTYHDRFARAVVWCLLLISPSRNRLCLPRPFQSSACSRSHSQHVDSQNQVPAMLAAGLARGLASKRGDESGRESKGWWLLKESRSACLVLQRG